jgi:hypothetical protein
MFSHFSEWRSHATFVLIYTQYYLVQSHTVSANIKEVLSPEQSVCQWAKMSFPSMKNSHQLACDVKLKNKLHLY